MKKQSHPFIVLFSLLLFAACANEGTSTESTAENNEETKQVLEVIDTVPVSTVYMKVMGKESLIQGDYIEGQDKEAFIDANHESSKYERLINVDVKGSMHAPKVEEEGFIEEEEGAVKYKMVAYDMLYMDKADDDEPFRVSVVTKVKDYQTWKWLYDMESKNRDNAGMKQLQLGINKEDPNEIFMLIAIPDIARARELMEQPGLESKMEQAGVIGLPVVKFWRPAGPQVEEL